MESESDSLDPEVYTLTAFTRALTAGARSALIKPTVRIFAPRRFQSLQLVKGRSGSPLHDPTTTLRETLKAEGLTGVSQRIAVPLAANMASGLVLFETYSAVESWAQQNAFNPVFSNLNFKDAVESPITKTNEEQIKGTRFTSIFSGPNNQRFGHPMDPSSEENDCAIPFASRNKVENSLAVTAFAASVSGIAHAAVACPLDNFLHNLHLISTRKETNSSQKLWLLNKNNIQLILKSLKPLPNDLSDTRNPKISRETVFLEDLKLKPLVYGWKSALFRDMAGYGTFFLGFEGTKKLMLRGSGSPQLDALLLEKNVISGKRKATDGPPLTVLGTILAGMVGGAGFRVVSFPIDWVSDFFLAHQKLVEKYRKEGEWQRLAKAVFGKKRQFWPTFGRSLLYSLPGAALTFLVYEHAKYYLD